MEKFKVGDKVRILDATQIAYAVEFGFKTDEIYEVLEIVGNGIPVIKDEESRMSLYPTDSEFNDVGVAGVILSPEELQEIYYAIEDVLKHQERESK